MCLRTVTEVNLQRKKVNGEIRFVGKGYKGMRASSIEDMIGKWCKAKPIHGVKNLETTSVGGIEYYPGFHIWTNLDDAMKFAEYYNKTLYEVSYYEVIAFGGNTNYGKKLTNHGRPCVIANWIKYERILDSKTGLPK